MRGGNCIARRGPSAGAFISVSLLPRTSWRGQARRRAGRTLTHEEVTAFGLDRLYLAGLTIARDERSRHVRPS